MACDDILWCPLLVCLLYIFLSLFPLSLHRFSYALVNMLLSSSHPIPSCPYLVIIFSCIHSSNPFNIHHQFNLHLDKIVIRAWIRWFLSKYWMWAPHAPINHHHYIADVFLWMSLMCGSNGVVHIASLLLVYIRWYPPLRCLYSHHQKHRF